jgi:DNA-binding IscR family transcriptional regulator
MLRMSKLTDYGTVVLAQLAASAPGWTTAGQVAEATHLGQPTVSKLLKALVHAGLVVSSRGVCDHMSYCRAGTAWQRINHSIRKALEGISLADLQHRHDPLPSLHTDLRDAAAAR